MAALINVSDVMTRLGISEDLQEAVTPAISAAIDAATIRLETELDTELAYGSGSAVFYLDPGAFSRIQPAGLFRCLLPQGFITATPELTVSLCDKMGAVTSELDSEYFRVDRARGLVLVDNEKADEYVSIEYSNGFADNEALVSQPWIKEALLAYVPMAMNAIRTDANQSSSPSPTSSSFRLNGEFAQGLIARYNRKIGLALRPLFSVWTPAGE